MQAGDIVVVRLDAGARLARFIETRSNRLRLAIGRNREARLPTSRLIHETGLNANGFDDVERLRQQAEAVADDLDLEELWDIVCDDGDALTLDDIGELYWGGAPSAAQQVGLLFHLLADDLRFAQDGSHFLPKDRETVSATIERRQRQAQRTSDAEGLAAAIRNGALPDALTSHQTSILSQLRAFVVHGDDYPRATFAKRFLADAGAGGRDARRAAFERFVALGLMDEDECLELERDDISAEFPQAALVEADAISAAPLTVDSRRADLTALTTLTIDDADTRDRDDALSIESLADGVHRVGIHIADAGALIPRGSALDVEADRRMSSLYLPDGGIAMLPPAVSAGCGSLNPSETRAAVSVFVDLSRDGEIVGWSASQSVIRSDVALSYEQADAAIADASLPMHAELSALDRLARALRARRESRGALRLERAELSVKVDADGGITVRVVPRIAPARSMIEECMVLCNSLLARYCAERDLPAPFRSQALPDVSDIMAQVEDGPLRTHLITRRLTAARVGVEPAPHGGLGVDAYTQATSPLRRYADLVVQRQISHHLRNGETLYDADAITSVAHRADMQMRQMRRIENGRRLRFFLKWLDARRLEAEANGGESVHAAIALENPGRRAATLELVEWPIRTRAALPGSVEPGDTVNLKLHGVDLWRRTAQFTLAVE